MSDLTPMEKRVAEAIWHTSRADEGTISATGANIIARALTPLIEQAKAEERERIAQGVENAWRAHLDRGNRCCAASLYPLPNLIREVSE